MITFPIQLPKIQINQFCDRWKIEELADILEREVGLVSKRAIARSHNWIRRQEILGAAKIIYNLKT